MSYTPRFPGRILFSPRDRGPTRARPSSHRRRSAAFRLERLEDRTVLSTLTVTTPLDEVTGSLRNIISRAHAGDTITFARSVHNITLTGGELVINLPPSLAPLDIEGRGPKKLAISGNDESRVFDIQSGTVTIAGLTIADGLADGNAPIIHSLGGGILNEGDLTLNHVVVSHNLVEALRTTRLLSTQWLSPESESAAASPTSARSPPPTARSPATRPGELQGVATPGPTPSPASALAAVSPMEG